MTPLVIKTCPICGSKRIRRVKRDIPSTRGGRPFVAHGVAVEECPNCGEILFSPESLDEIEAQRPRARKAPHKRKSA
jgi:YgiT-type zinc finger domain-containing protein